jgi:prolyl oligopeptidase
MLRYHKFTIGGAWIPEFGNPDVAEDFAFISKSVVFSPFPFLHCPRYSPLHALRVPPSGVQWPATLLMTADHDDRVVPLHTLKYVAQLYHLLAKDKPDQQRPVLVRVEVRAGHGAGKPMHKIVSF